MVLRQPRLDAQVSFDPASSLERPLTISQPHSGCISGFRDIIRRLQGDLRDEFFHFPQGNTDSEWAFACFLEQLARVSRVELLDERTRRADQTSALNSSPTPKRARSAIRC